MKTSIAALFTSGLLVIVSSVVTAAPTLDQQLVGPVGEKEKYVISPRGHRLATVSPKGSRVTVVVDGVVGPRFDEIVETAGVIDPRPWVGVDVNLHPRSGPVTFSRDGSRYAYVGRLSQEWVIMVDNKESFRIPAPSNREHVSLEFSGEQGKHLLFSTPSFPSYALWVDGQRWPGTYVSGGGGSDGTVDPIISPDGEHVAYLAVISRDKNALIVDGKDAGYYGTRLAYTPDSKHLICLSESPKGRSVLLDGKPLFTARQILNVYVPPVGSRLIFELMHLNAQGSNEGSFLLVDGKPAEATHTKDGNITTVIFSPDGKHYAAVCGKTGNQFVVIDGKKGQEYFSIADKDIADLATGIKFSPDSSKVVYTAYASGGRDQFVVVNEDESDALGNPWFKFSPDGKRLAYGGLVNQNQNAFLNVDGKTVRLPPGVMIDQKTFRFSPDSSHYAFSAVGRSGSPVFLDGKSTEIVGHFTFSPDSKHLAITGGGGAGPEKKQGLFLDGQNVFEPNSSFQQLTYATFSPDSQHLIWEQLEPAVGANAQPGGRERLICVDGVPVASTRVTDPAYGAPGVSGSRTMMDMGNDANIWRTRTRLGCDAMGRFVAIAPTEEGVQRFVITPPPDTNLETMIAEAKAAPARAAAKAAEEKKNVAPNARKAAVPPPAQPTVATTPAARPSGPAPVDPVADAANKAKAKTDAAAAKAKAFIDALTPKK